MINAEAAAAAALFNSGYLRLYTGTQPANANAALSGNTLLATLRFNATAFANVNGVLTANAITSDTNAAATGTATFFRAFESDGTTVLMDGSIGTSGANMNIATTSINAGQTVSCSSFVHTLNEATSGL
jgi:hypothetical protein